MQPAMAGHGRPWPTLFNVIRGYSTLVGNIPTLFDAIRCEIHELFLKKASMIDHVTLGGIPGSICIVVWPAWRSWSPAAAGALAPTFPSRAQVTPRWCSPTRFSLSEVCERRILEAATWTASNAVFWVSAELEISNFHD